LITSIWGGLSTYSGLQWQDALKMYALDQLNKILIILNYTKITNTFKNSMGSVICF